MNFNSHLELVGKHAFLSPSKYHWINYDDNRLEARFLSAMASQKGTELHNFAQQAIDLGINLPKRKTTLNMYVNDGIGYKMSTEVHLFYSPNCFGQADTICFRDDLLRIHDLKTGVTQSSFDQLKVYAALFCLEYGRPPDSMDMCLRIYQNNEIRENIPYSDEIETIMDKIVYFDDMIETIRERGEY